MRNILDKCNRWALADKVAKVRRWHLVRTTFLGIPFYRFPTALEIALADGYVAELRRDQPKHLKGK